MWYRTAVVWCVILWAQASFTHFALILWFLPRVQCNQVNVITHSIRFPFKNYLVVHQQWSINRNIIITLELTIWESNIRKKREKINFIAKSVIHLQFHANHREHRRRKNSAVNKYLNSNHVHYRYFRFLFFFVDSGTLIQHSIRWYTEHAK